MPAAPGRKARGSPAQLHYQFQPIPWATPSNRRRNARFAGGYVAGRGRCLDMQNALEKSVEQSGSTNGHNCCRRKLLDQQLGHLTLGRCAPSGSVTFPAPQGQRPTTARMSLWQIGGLPSTSTCSPGPISAVIACITGVASCSITCTPLSCSE